MDVTRREVGALGLGAVITTGLGAATSAGARAAEPSNTLIEGQNLSQNLDPHQLYDVPTLSYTLNTYDTLYRNEGNPPKLTPWLATGHTVSPDGLDWDFSLVKGVKFHDGSELTAEDVVYSFQRLLGMGKAPAAAFLPVLKPENVTAPDKYTVHFKLSVPYAPFLAAIPIACIVNSRQVKQHAKDGDWAATWLASNEAGSGAYKLDPATYVPLTRIDCARYPEHFKGWDENPRPVAAIAYRPANETSTRILALLKGRIDWTGSYLPPDDVAEIERSPIARVEKDESMRLFLIHMNNTKPPLDNLNARKGFAHAFDYDGFIKVIMKGYAQRDPAPLPNNLWGFPKDANGYDFDLKKAKMYFDKAKAEGAPMHRPVEIHIQAALAQTTQAAQLFQSTLASIGVNLKIVNDTWAHLVTNMSTAEETPQMWITWVSAYFIDPDNWIGQMYDSQYHGTWKASSWYTNKKVDELLRTARSTIGQDKRAPMYEEASKLVMADSPDIWIYNTVGLRGMNKRVKGFRFCPVGSGAEVQWIHLSTAT